jgi:uncharacterized membrane protein
MSPSLRQEREFGLLVGAIFCALAGWWLYRRRLESVRPVVLAIGCVLVFLGAFFPKALRLPLRLWTGLAEALSFVTTRVILAIVFFVVVTPIGLIGKALGRDPLRRRAKPADSFWWPYSDRQHDPKHYEKMF